MTFVAYVHMLLKVIAKYIVLVASVIAKRFCPQMSGHALKWRRDFRG